MENWFKYFEIKPKGIIHVGAHLGQEIDFYNSLEVNNVVWFEAIPEVFRELETKIKKYPNHLAINSLIYSKSGKSVRFYVSSNEKISSSLNKPLMHLAVFPSIRFNKTINLITETLDNIVQKKKIKLAEYNCLVLDTQGSELEVLKGFQKGLGSIDIIVTEISIKKLYKNSVLFIQLKKWLENQNFILVASRIHQEIGDGDALFLKKDAAKILLLGKEAKHEISGRKFVFGILVRSILIKFLPGGLVSKIARKKTRGL